MFGDGDKNKKQNKNNALDLTTGKIVEVEDRVVVINPATGKMYKTTNPLRIDHRAGTMNVDPVMQEEFENLGINPTQNVREDIGKTIIAKNKPFLDQAGNAVKQFGYNTVGGFGMAVSGNDLGAAIDIAKGAEREYENALFKWSNDLIKEGKEKYPIFQEAEGAVNPGDPNWWLQHGADFGTSGGFAAYSVAESVLLGIATAETGGVGAIANLASKGQKIAKIRELSAAKKLKDYFKANNSTKVIRNQALLGASQGYREGLVESYDSYTSIKEDYLKKGYTEEDAKKYASLGAVKTFRTGVLPNMILNSVSLAATSYNPITKKSKGILDRKIKNPVAKGVANTTADMANEFTEEFIQSAAQKEGRAAADLAAGEKEKGISLTEHLTDEENWNAGIGGIFGSIGFKGLSYLKNNKNAKLQDAHWAEKHSQHIEALNNRSLGYLKSIKEAEDKEDYGESIRLRREMNSQNTLKSLYLDDVSDNDSGYKGQMAYYENVLNYINTGQTELLEELKIQPEDYDFIKEKFPIYIKDSKNIKKHYDIAKERHSSNAVLPITENKHALDLIREKRESVKQDIEDIKSNNGYDKLSVSGQNYLEDSSRFTDLLIASENTSITEDQKNEIDELRKSLSYRRELRDQKIDLKNDHEDFQLSQDLSKDDDLIWELNNTDKDGKTINSFEDKTPKNLDFNNRLLGNLNKAEKQLQKNIKYWSDPKNQIAEAKKETFRQVDEAETVQELEQAEQQLEQLQEATAPKQNAEQVDEAEIVQPKTTETQEIELKQAEAKARKEALETTQNTGQNVETPSIPKPKKGNLTLGDILASQGDFVGLSEEGNSNEDFDRLDAMFGETPDINFNEDTNNLAGEEDHLTFDPVEFTPEIEEDERLNDAADIVKKTRKRLSQELGRTSTFKDYIEKYISLKGKESADKLFNVFKWSWQKNKFQKTNFDKVYDQVFNTYEALTDKLTTLGDAIVEPNTPDVVEKTNNDFIKEIIMQEKPVEKLDQNNQPVNTPVSHNLITHTGLRADYELAQVEDNKLVGEIVQNPVALFDSENLNSKQLLNPDKFNSGTPMMVEIPDNYRELKVQTWEDALTKGEVMTFQNWMDKNDVSRGSQEWLDKVPMFAYELDSNGEKGEAIFKIHSTDNYNLTTVGEGYKSQLEMIEEGRGEISKIRQNVFANDSTEITITEKRIGSWITVDEPITLNQANPDSVLVLATKTGFLVNGTNERFETNGRVILNKDKNFRPGSIYDLRKATNKNEYIAFQVIQPYLSKENIETAADIVSIYMHQLDVKNTYGKRSIHKEQAKKIEDITKLNIASGYKYDEEGQTFMDDDFEELLFSLVRVKTFRGLSSIEDLPQYLNKTYISPSGETVPLIKNGEAYVIKVGKSLAIGIKGKKIGKKLDYLFLNPYMVAKGKTKPFIIDNFLKVLKEDVLPKIRHNINKDSLRNNRKSVQISDGVVSEGSNYRDHLKNTLQTTVKSFNVGTKNKPFYATIVNPKISFKVKGENKKETFKEPVLEEDFSDVEPLVGEESVPSEVSEALQALKDLGIDLDSPDIQNDLDGTGINTDDYLSLATYTNLNYENIKSSRKAVPELTSLQNYELVNFIFNKTIEALGTTKKSNKQDVLRLIKKSYMDNIRPIRTKNRRLIKTLEGQPKYVNIVSRLKKENKVFEDINNSWTAIETQAFDKISKYFPGVKEVYDITTDEYEEKDHSKISLELSGKNTASKRLKKFLVATKDITSKGEVKRGYLGVETYISFDEVYNNIEKILSTPYEMLSDFDLMLLRLEENTEAYKWLPQVINKLKNAPQRVKNEFTYNFARHTLSMKFIMYSKGKDGKYTLKVYDTNAGEITRTIREAWQNNLKAKNLVGLNEDTGLHNINKVEAQKLLSEYNDWVKLHQLDYSKIKNEKLLTWLDKFGLSLSEETLDELKTNNTEIITNEGKSKVAFNSMFVKGQNTPGIFGLLADYLEGIVKKDNTDFDENPSNHPFNNANNVLKTLSKIESKYSTTTTTNSFRDGGKSIYGFTQSKYITDSVRRLKYDNDYKQTLKSKSFNGKSFILDLLINSEDFQNKFGISHVGINAFKELNKKYYGVSELTGLPDKDQEGVKLGFFQDMKQGTLSDTIGDSIKMRIAKMFVPTMSDKSQMTVLNTAVLNIRDKHFDISQKGELKNKYKFKNELKEVLYDQLILPELDRIVNFNSVVEKTNIAGYDKAAKLFLMFPQLSNLKYFDKDIGKDKRVISLMASNPTKFNKRWFEDNIKEKAIDRIINIIKTKHEDKLAQWERNEFFTRKNGNISQVKYLDNSYLNTIGGALTTKVEIAALDFIINSMISNANVHMTIAGDIAMYSKDKIGKYFNDGNVISPKDEYGDEAYILAVKDVIEPNLGKRMALLIAPGNKLAGSDSKNEKNNKYVQIFVNDYKVATKNIVTLVDLYYTADDVKIAEELVQQYENATTFEGKKLVTEKLGKYYPEIKDYFDLEATDAQEYTTSAEHINVLWKQGRLDDDQYVLIQAKLKRQFEAEQKGKEINKTDLLNYQELKLILQPLKPVHAGFKDEVDYDSMRMVYVKSSSFPLIPQLTIGTELDGLRKLLEKYEKKREKFVRVSYQSANKVGANTNSVNLFKPNGDFNNKLTLEMLDNASLTLDRTNFRIQQDVPYKSDKKYSDKVSIGTQTLKMLFGDGITDIEAKIFNFKGKKYNGKGLLKIFNGNFESYIQEQKTNLLDELGVDEFGKPLDPVKTLTKLQNILKDEANKRGYPIQDVEALGLSTKLDKHGKVVDIQFDLPLWLSPNSNRYEALLNSIVTNRLVNIKVPGSSYVVGSEAGFKTKSLGEIQNTTKIASTIFELRPNISDKEIITIYNRYKKLMNIKREGKHMSFDNFQKFLKSSQVFNYKNTYIFGNYDYKNGVFITRVNSSPTSKELLAEALPKLVEQGIDFVSFVPEDLAKKYVRSGYHQSKSSFAYNFKGEDMDKFMVTSQKNIANKIFNKNLEEISGEDIKQYNKEIPFKYQPTEITGDLIEQAGKDLNKILETYLNQFGIVVKDLKEIQENLNVDSLGFADILSKVAYTKNKEDLPPIAGEFIAYMMQYNPLVSEIIKELSETKDYKGLDKADYFKIIGELIAKDLSNKLDGDYKKSLLDKIRELVALFFDKMKSVPTNTINENIGIISNNILQQNKKLITASLYKPGAFGKPTKQVSLSEAKNSDSFGKIIIENLGAKGFILTGSTALGEQGTIQRPNENLLHDIDWVSPFSRKETKEKFLDSYPDAIFVRAIPNQDYTTDSYIISPDGTKIIDYKTKKIGEKIIIDSYNVANKKGEIIGTYKLEKNKDNKLIEKVTGVEAKVIDFFSYENYKGLKPFNKDGLNLSNWKSIFQAKLDFARYKDIWDYNRFIPNENLPFIKNKDIDQKPNLSKIIYTSAWTGSLKPAEIIEGKLKKTQVLLPSKFRTNEGKLINFFDENGNHNETYVKVDNKGNYRLKEDKIDPELLSLTSFRIPTSGHVSMSQLEIVGFLPKEMGDLLIVPANLTAQKGLDFDIDKETTYQYNTYVDKEGNIRVLSEEHRNEILADSDKELQELKAAVESGEQDAKLLIDIFGDDILNENYTEEDFKANKHLKKVNSKLTSKILENDFVGVHQAILGNSDKKVQGKINKVLSMDFANSQKELVRSVTKNSKELTSYTLLDDTHQKNKMELGASGKLGIGVYSNYSVFASLVQQAENKLILKEQIKLPSGNVVKDITFNLGNKYFDGRIGRVNSISGRSIAEAFAERQNTATDNEKEQIMGSLNINSVTINVDSLLTLMGFDKDSFEITKEEYLENPISAIVKKGKYYRVVSLPYMFLNQPIIKEYVDKIRRSKSLISKFDPAAEAKIIAELKDKYGEKDKIKIANERMLTGKNLLANISGKPDGGIQLRVLELFLKLDKIAKKVAKIQKTLNINNGGLGKSFFETINKFDKIRNLKLDYDIVVRKSGKIKMEGSFAIQNISSLVGDYRYSDKAIKGFVDMGDGIYIRPKTPIGSMAVHATQTGFNLWGKYFPYGDKYITKAVEFITSEIGGEEISQRKEVEIYETVFSEMKKYFFTSKVLGLYEGDVQNKRYELFIDYKDKKKSLATYLSDLSFDKESPVKDNTLLSRFTYKLSKTGVPSLIQFNNTKAENFDEEYLYQGITELLEKNIELPKFNDREYSSRELAVDLIAYAYLEGGIQKAVQFVKYIPIPLLKHIPFAKYTREWDNRYRPDIFGKMLGYFGDVSSTTFLDQFSQNNLEKLSKADLKDSGIINRFYGDNTQKLDSLVEFSLDKDTVQGQKLKEKVYISIYNKNIKHGLPKFQVYKKDGNLYKRISVLGAFGMSEYDMNNPSIDSLVNKNFKPEFHGVSLASLPKQKPVKNLDLIGVTLIEALNQITNLNLKTDKHLKVLSKLLTRYVGNDIKFDIADIVNKKGEHIGAGSFNSKKNLLTIDRRFYAEYPDSEIAKTLVHETIHALSVNYIRKYVNRDGTLVENTQTPVEINELIKLFNSARKHIGIDKINKLIEKQKKHRIGTLKEKITSYETSVVYGGTDISEFITLILTEPNFQKEMAKIEYQSNQSILDKMVDIVYSILNKIFENGLSRNNVTFHGVKTSLQIIKQYDSNKKAVKSENLNTLKSMDTSNRKAETLIENVAPKPEVKGLFGLPPIDLTHLQANEEDINFNIKENIITNPFKCK